jgi:hypothetical protein
MTKPTVTDGQVKLAAEAMFYPQPDPEVRALVLIMEALIFPTSIKQYDVDVAFEHLKTALKEAREKWGVDGQK